MSDYAFDLALARAQDRADGLRGFRSETVWV